jgi:hypothetical protein
MVHLRKHSGGHLAKDASGHLLKTPAFPPTNIIVSWTGQRGSLPSPFDPVYFDTESPRTATWVSSYRWDTPPFPASDPTVTVTLSVLWFSIPTNQFEVRFSGSYVGPGGSGSFQTRFVRTGSQSAATLYGTYTRAGTPFSGDTLGNVTVSPA